MWKKIISIMCLVVGIFSTLCMLNEVMPYYKAMKAKDELSKQVITEYTQTVLPETIQQSEEEVVKTNIDFNNLQKQNPDIIGWIRAPQVNIDYPILKGETDDYYLHRDYKKNRSSLGSIFTWAETNEMLNEDHIVIFGHNCIGKQMFGGLKDFRNEALRKENPYIDIYTKTQHKVLEVNDVRIVDHTDPILQYGYMNTNMEQTIILATCFGPQGTKNRIIVECKVLKTEEIL